MKDLPCQAVAKSSGEHFKVEVRLGAFCARLPPGCPALQPPPVAVGGPGILKPRRQARSERWMPAGQADRALTVARIADRREPAGVLGRPAARSTAGPDAQHGG